MILSVLNISYIRNILKKILYRIIILFSSIYHPIICLLNKDKYQKNLRIIVYHSVCKTDSAKNIREWNLPLASFHAQMDYIASHQYNVFTVDHAICYLNSGKPFPEKSVCITFDDGFHDNYLYAYPILLRYGLKATFYLVTEYVDSNKSFSWLKHGDPSHMKTKGELSCRSMDWSEVVEMKNHGMDFSSHSHTHPNFSELDIDKCKWEIIESRKVLESHIGSVSKVFACPFYIHGPNITKVKQLLQENGFNGAFFNKFGAVTSQSDCFDLPRISIYGNDSLAVFKCKINGGFDWLVWYYSMWQNFWTFINSMRKRHT